MQEAISAYGTRTSRVRFLKPVPSRKTSLKIYLSAAEITLDINLIQDNLTKENAKPTTQEREHPPDWRQTQEQERTLQVPLIGWQCLIAQVGLDKHLLLQVDPPRREGCKFCWFSFSPWLSISREKMWRFQQCPWLKASQLTTFSSLLDCMQEYSSTYQMSRIGSILIECGSVMYSTL